MEVLKNGKTIYGASLTAAERKAMNLEIQRQTKIFDEEHIHEMDAAVLWTMHEIFGMGPDRLKKFYDKWLENKNDILNQYDMDPDKFEWLCTKKLKDYGIDINEWRNNIIVEDNSNGQ